MLEYIFAILEWCKVVIFLHGKRPALFKEGEIWWCSIGMNVGVEIFGKGSKFERPVLVLKKFSAASFLAIPLTSRDKQGNWYTPIHFGNAQATLILNQVRTLDAKRLIKRMDILSEENFRSIQQKFLEFYGQ